MGMTVDEANRILETYKDDPDYQDSEQVREATRVVNEAIQYGESQLEQGKQSGEIPPDARIYGVHDEGLSITTKGEVQAIANPEVRAALEPLKQYKVGDGYDLTRAYREGNWRDVEVAQKIGLFTPEDIIMAKLQTNTNFIAKIKDIPEMGKKRREQGFIDKEYVEARDALNPYKKGTSYNLTDAIVEGDGGKVTRALKSGVFTPEAVAEANKRAEVLISLAKYKTGEEYELSRAISEGRIEDVRKAQAAGLFGPEDVIKAQIESSDINVEKRAKETLTNYTVRKLKEGKIADEVDTARWLRDNPKGRMTLEQAGISKEAIDKAEEYANKPYVRETAQERLAKALVQADYDYSNKSSQNIDSILKAHPEIILLPATDGSIEGRRQEPEITRAKWIASFVAVRQDDPDFSRLSAQKRDAVLSDLANSEYNRLYGRGRAVASSTLDVLKGLVPGLNTAQEWNNMTPLERATSISGDVGQSILYGIGAYSIARVLLIPKPKVILPPGAGGLPAEKFTARTPIKVYEDAATWDLNMSYPEKQRFLQAKALNKYITPDVYKMAEDAGVKLYSTKVTKKALMDKLGSMPSISKNPDLEQYIRYRLGYKVNPVKGNVSVRDLSENELAEYKKVQELNPQITASEYRAGKNIRKTIERPNIDLAKSTGLTQEEFDEFIALNRIHPEMTPEQFKLSKQLYDEVNAWSKGKKIEQQYRDTILNAISEDKKREIEKYLMDIAAAEGTAGLSREYLDYIREKENEVGSIMKQVIEEKRKEMQAEKARSIERKQEMGQGLNQSDLDYIAAHKEDMSAAEIIESITTPENERYIAGLLARMTPEQALKEIEKDKVSPPKAGGAIKQYQVIKVVPMTASERETLQETSTQTQPLTKTQLQTLTAVKTKLQTALQTQLQTQTQTKLATKTQPLTKTQLQTLTAVKTKLQTALQTQLQTQTQTKLATKTKLQLQTLTKLMISTKTLTKTDVKVLTDLTTKTATDTTTDTVTRLKTGSTPIIPTPGGGGGGDGGGGQDEPEKRFRIRLGGDPDKKKREYLSKVPGMIARRRGELNGKPVWRVWHYPYGPNDKMVIVGSAPSGAKEVKGKGSVAATATVIRGLAPTRKLYDDTGAVDDIIVPIGKNDIRIESVRDTAISEKSPRISIKQTRISPKFPRLR